MGCQQVSTRPNEVGEHCKDQPGRLSRCFDAPEHVEHAPSNDFSEANKAFSKCAVDYSDSLDRLIDVDSFSSEYWCAICSLLSGETDPEMAIYRSLRSSIGHL